VVAQSQNSAAPVGGRHQDLERAEIGGHEGRPRDPGGQRAAGEEEVEVGLDQATGGEADPDHRGEVQRDDRVIERRCVDPEHCAGDYPR
jgi:hypothetical protein